MSARERRLSRQRWLQAERRAHRPVASLIAEWSTVTWYELQAAPAIDGWPALPHIDRDQSRFLRIMREVVDVPSVDGEMMRDPHICPFCRPPSMCLIASVSRAGPGLCNRCGNACVPMTAELAFGALYEAAGVRLQPPPLDAELVRAALARPWPDPMIGASEVELLPPADDPEA